MDLLNQNQYEKPKTKGKGIIIALLIISILAVFTIIAIMLYIEANKVAQDTLYINGVQQEIATDLIVADTAGIKYISLKDLSVLLGYEYYNSEYNNYGVDTTKCYVKNKNLISGCELGTNQIYKYEEGTNLDYQIYSLKHNIITYNNKLYIAIEDLSQAINVYCIVNENNEIQISTMEYLATAYQEQLREKGYTVATEPNNQKALSYGWIIVKKGNLWSVLNTDLQEIIGPKYSTIYFDEENQNYIVSNSNGQYGVISSAGNIEHSLRYDGMELLNYENMLYKVKYNEKYGIMKADGTMLTEIIYDEIGYKPEPDKKILYTLIIPEINGRSGPLIAVKQNEFYGLITLENGETFLQCDHVEKLYSISELGEIKYLIEAEKQTMDLLEYLKLRNLVVVELN